MFAKKVIFVTATALLIASTCGPPLGFAQGAPQCQAIKRYPDQVEQYSTFNFGEDRENKPAEAHATLLKKLAELNYRIPDEPADLLKRYVGLTSLGHDKMRKGDASLLVKAREMYEKIRGLCPW
jgi:hypothetical protein